MASGVPFRSVFYLLVAVAGCLGTTEGNDGVIRRADSSLAATCDEIRARELLQQSRLGVAIVHVASGEVVYEHSADEFFPPASAAKLLTCGGALLTLGSDFRFQTRVVTTSPIQRGIVRGDVVLVGAGDPNLSQRVRPGDRLAFKDNDHSYAGFHPSAAVPGDPLTVVRNLARQIKAAGVRQISGSIVVDDGLFAESFDRFVGTFGAVCVNDNLVDVMVTPGREVGDPVEFEVQPDSRMIEIRSAARTSPPGTKVELDLELRRGIASFDLVGSVPHGSKPLLRVAAVRAPSEMAAHYLHEALRNVGVDVRGKTRVSGFGPAVYSQYHVVARHTSPPLSETIRVILKVSQNVHATMLPPLIGALKGERGDRFEGFRIIRGELERRKFDLQGVAVRSGSGGDRADRATPRWMASFLRRMAQQKEFPHFFSALAVAGSDGSLARSLDSSSLIERVHAKTGSLVYREALGGRWVYLAKTLCGYLDLRAVGRRDGLYAFAIMIADTVVEDRHRGARELSKAQEDILRAAVRTIESAASSSSDRRAALQR